MSNTKPREFFLNGGRIWTEEHLSLFKNDFEAEAIRVNSHHVIEIKAYQAALEEIEDLKAKLGKLSESLKEALYRIEEHSEGCLYCGVSLGLKYDEYGKETQWHIDNCWHNKALLILKSCEEKK